MSKKLWVCLALAVSIPGLLFTGACAKKVVKSEPSVTTTQKPTEDKSAIEAARKAEEQRKAQEAARQAELERQRKIEEQRLKEQEEAARREMLAARNIFMSEDIYFDFDSSVLTSAAQSVLQRKAEWMRANSTASVIIEGHCDERGTNAYNLALGDRRAESAKDFLMDLGIEATRLATISYGEERPVDTGQTEEAWAKNRRAHFVVE